MKLDELYEATWLGHQAKRIGTKLGSKIVPKSLGGAQLSGMAQIRERVSDLINAWKRMEGMGHTPTLANVNSWLQTGENPIASNVTDMSSANMGIYIQNKNKIMSNNHLRTYFQKIAQAEARTKRSKDADVGTTTGKVSDTNKTVADLSTKVASLDSKLDLIIAQINTALE